MIRKVKNLYTTIIGSFRLFLVFIIDALRYFKATKNFWNQNIEKLESSIIKLSHSLEKRISFENLDSQHGKSKAFELIQKIEEYNKNENKKDYLITWASSVLIKYSNDYLHNKEKEMLKSKINKISTLNNSNLNTNNGGAFSVNKEQLLVASKDNFFNFSQSRHSIRNFNGYADLNMIKQAVQLAQKCPSSCNVQPIKVYLITENRKIKEVLELQKGNRGFTEKIPQIIIITANLKLYSGYKERNQGYIDGGIFSLSLAYSLHYYEIGSCLLNWASKRKDDKKLRKLLNIPFNEIIIVVMAIGKYPENCLVPYSKRRPIDEVFTEIS